MSPELGVVILLLAQTPAAPLSKTARDPVTVRGCLEGRGLRILEADASELSGVRKVRVKGPRAMMRMLDDGRGAYLEVTGDLDAARPDRGEMRRRYKAGSKTTVSVGAASEQIKGPAIAAEPTLVVEAFTRLAETCPAR